MPQKETGNAAIILLLVLVLAGAAAISLIYTGIVKLPIPSSVTTPSPAQTNTQQYLDSAASPSTNYQNPFDSNAKASPSSSYTNPFASTSTYQNPFDNLH